MSDENLKEIRLKLLIIGDTNVGKTSILLNYTDNYFPETHLATIGVEYKVKQLIKDNYNITLQIWDTAGQERFRSITKSFFHNANGILFVYDVTKRESFHNVKDWIKDSEMHDNGFKKILVGNKIDLEESREVKYEELKELGKKKDIDVIETSAKNKTNIDEAFEKMVDLILKNKSEMEIMENFGMKSTKELNLNKHTLIKKEGCCGKK